MNSIVVGCVSTDKHLIFDSGTRAELVFRAALAGVDKEVAIGLRLARMKITSEVVWLEPRISALEICSDYKRMTKKKSGINSISWARDFVEALLDDGSRGLHSSALEKLSAEHFSSENIVVNFDPYSLDDDAKVDIFLNYRKNCILESVKMEMLLPFLKDDCFCSAIKAERHCILCG